MADGNRKFGPDSWVKLVTVLLFSKLYTLSRSASLRVCPRAIDFSIRKSVRLTLGVRYVPMGSTRTVIDGIVAPPAADTVRANGTPLRFSKWAETSTSHGSV